MVQTCLIELTFSKTQTLNSVSNGQYKLKAATTFFRAIWSLPCAANFDGKLCRRPVGYQRSSRWTDFSNLHRMGHKLFSKLKPCNFTKSFQFLSSFSRSLLPVMFKTLKPRTIALKLSDLFVRTWPSILNVLIAWTLKVEKKIRES